MAAAHVTYFLAVSPLFFNSLVFSLPRFFVHPSCVSISCYLWIGVMVERFKRKPPHFFSRVCGLSVPAESRAARGSHCCAVGTLRHSPFPQRPRPPVLCIQKPILPHLGFRVHLCSALNFPVRLYTRSPSNFLMFPASAAWFSPPEPAMGPHRLLSLLSYHLPHSKRVRKADIY